MSDLIRVDVKQLLEDWEAHHEDGYFAGGHPIYQMALEIDYLRKKNQQLQARVAELDKGSYETDERLPMNMCDGCARSLPIVNGLHRKADGAPVMACSATLYRNPMNSIAAQQLRKGEE